MAESTKALVSYKTHFCHDLDRCLRCLDLRQRCHSFPESSRLSLIEVAIDDAISASYSA
jgi:hypothetical protein